MASRDKNPLPFEEYKDVDTDDRPVVPFDSENEDPHDDDDDEDDDDENPFDDYDDDESDYE